MLKCMSMNAAHQGVQNISAIHFKPCWSLFDDICNLCTWQSGVDWFNWQKWHQWRWYLHKFFLIDMGHLHSFIGHIRKTDAGNRSLGLSSKSTRQSGLKHIISDCAKQHHPKFWFFKKRMVYYSSWYLADTWIQTKPVPNLV